MGFTPSLRRKIYIVRHYALLSPGVNRLTNTPLPRLVFSIRLPFSRLKLQILINPAAFWPLGLEIISPEKPQ